MAAKVQALDVWLVEGDTVYKEVPFTVVVDWIQEGRLLENDHVRPPGTEKWIRLGASKLAVYLPKAEPQRPQDQAEALEAVVLDFTFKRPHSDEDDDPDMIPLIDISLVLLVFFMMTASVVVSATTINVPSANNAFLTNPAGTYWIGIDRTIGPDGLEGPPKYSFGEGEKPPEPENNNLTEADVIKRLVERLKQDNQRADVRIAADTKLPADVVMGLTAALEPVRRAGFIRDIRAEVSERKP